MNTSRRADESSRADESGPYRADEAQRASSPYLDLSQVPIVDNHAHPLTRSQPQTGEELRRHFSEAHSPELARSHVGSAVSYRWTVRQLAEPARSIGGLRVQPTEDAILLCRAAVPFSSYARDLIQSANLDSLLIDEGYPPPDKSYSAREMEDMLGVPVRRILRLETLAQDLILAHGSFSEVVAAFDNTVSDARRSGFVALKSIAAYRTGLQIEPVDDRTAKQTFEPVREQADREGALRLSSKPLVDYFVWRAVRLAAEQGLPVQFHTGYGDPDLDLRLANPLHLRPLFEDARLHDAPIVLLHESYPFTAEAAYLAAVYPNAYLDIAFSLPPLSRQQLLSSIQTALGAAPASKIMVSSDGTCIPEHYWLGAVRARALLSEALDSMIASGELGPGDARELGTMILRDNARHVYRLPTT